MDRQPRLFGPTLNLRPLSQADRDPLYAVAADPELWVQHPMHDRWQRPVFDAFFDEAMAHRGALVVIERASGRIIGSSQYRRSAHIARAMEIGWTFLSRAQWGGATNRELKGLMLSHLFTHEENAIFRVGESNLRSRRAMEKIGGRLLPQTEQTVLADGRAVTHVIYAIDRAGFAAGPLNSL